MKRCFISLGSNLGDQKFYLREAIKRLKADEKVRVIRTSSIYKTEPVGYENQPWFFNAVAELTTTYSPESLLDKLLEVEKVLGRVRDIRWGPRTLDLDLLLFDGLEISTERLVVPHPRMFERDFVLIPLMEIAPDLMVADQTICELVGEVKKDKKVVCTRELLC